MCNLTAKDQQSNLSTDRPSKVAPNYYQQTCEERNGNSGVGAGPTQYLGWGLLNNQNYVNAEQQCEA